MRSYAHRRALAAEVAAHRPGLNVDRCRVEPEALGQLRAQPVGRLGGRPDPEPAVLEGGDAALRLQVALRSEERRVGKEC